MGLFNLFTKKKRRAVEPPLDGVDIHLREMPGAVQVIDGFPRIDWSVVGNAIVAYTSHPHVDRLWTELAAQWLVIVGDQLGSDYKLYESDRLFFMSNLPGVTRNLATIGDAAYTRLERLLRPSTTPHGAGKHAVLVFDNDASYYDYVSYFYPDREQAFGTSAGMQIRKGYAHTVVRGRLQSTDRTLVHELAHYMVGDRPLPRWLDEGVAQFMEDMIPGYRAPLIDHRQARLHRRYWSWFGIRHVWNGRAFSGVGSQRLSYQLAEILFRNLAGHPSPRKHLQEFLATAHRDDSGAAACTRCFGSPLSTLVEEFLGPGDWEPAPVNTP